MKLLKIIALFLGCRLIWIWFDLCGDDLGLGETLPFCIKCSGAATFFRLVFLGLAIWIIVRLLQNQPTGTQIFEEEEPPGHTFIIHWHRIALMLALVSYPLWIWWIDKNTIIPSPNEIWLIRYSCIYPGVKGTMLWGLVLLFIVGGFGILHKR